MKFSKTLLASAISVLLLGTSGCSDSESQDEQMEDTTSFVGLVVDGRIARGFVWVDTDDDGVIDTYEPYAYTDVDGYFSYNPLTNTDYCALDIEHDHCLNTGIVQGDFSLKIAGGVDLSTGEPFEGVMTLDANTDDAKEVEQQVSESTGSESSKPDFVPVISPLTTLVGDGSDAEKIDLLTKLGITGIDSSTLEELLKLDYTDFSDDEAVSFKGSIRTASGITTASDVTSGDMKRAIFGRAFQYQKTLDSLSAMVDEYISGLNIDISTDDDGNPLAGTLGSYLNLEIRAYVSATTFDPDLDMLSQISSTDLQSIISAALNAFLFDNPGISIPSMPASAIESIDTTLGLIIDTAIETVVNVESEEELLAGLLATQTLVTAAQEQLTVILSGSTSQVEDALETINDVVDTVQSDEFIDALSSLEDGESIDVKQLADDLLDGKDADESIENSTLAQAPGADEEGIWAQRVLSMSGKDDESRGRVLIFFGGSSTLDRSGDVTICYAYNSLVDNDDDIDPTYIKGTWQELNSRGIVQLNQDLVSFTVKALKQDVIPADEIDTVVGLGDFAGDVSDSDLYGHLRFSSDEGQYVWFSDLPLADQTDPDTRDFGLLDSATVPSNSSECESFTVGGIPSALTKNLGF